MSRGLTEQQARLHHPQTYRLKHSSASDPVLPEHHLSGDGREETLQGYLLETRIWKGRVDDARSNASWSQVTQPTLPMDLSNKAVHLLTPEEAKEPPAKK